MMRCLDKNAAAALGRAACYMRRLLANLSANLGVGSYETMDLLVLEFVTVHW